ncbi:MAG: DUF935 family protein, partial [Acidobacteria bacterium]|nr:DUF935 family protein [Acidobacteriota bacterium]
MIAVALPKLVSSLEREMAAENQVERYNFPNSEDPHPSEILRTRSRPEHRLGELYPWMMERDLDLGSYCAKLVDAVLALPRSIDPDLPATPEAEEAARFVRAALTQIPDFRLALEHLAYAPFHGVALVELLWHRLPEGEFAGAWVPAKMIDRPLWRFGFKEGELFVRRRDGRHETPPPGKFLVHRWGTADTPWGKSLLDKAYWFSYVKMELLKMMSGHLERHASPMPYVKYPWSRGDSPQAK